MVFKDFRLNVVVRVLGLTLTIFVLVYAFKSSNYVVTLVLIGGLVVYQVVALVRLMEYTNRELVDFLSSIRYDDFSHTYKLTGQGGSFDQLNQEFNKVLKKFKEIRAEKEAEYQYLKNIIHHVSIGIVSFDKNGDVQIINTAAKRLFQVNRLRNIRKLEEFSPELIEQFRQLRTGAKTLIRVRKNGEVVQLAIYAIELYLKGEEFKLLTVQNIHSELEEQEMEAWQNLIRVLTHEIMNSVTPVSSLANTAEEEISYLQEKGSATREDLEDVQAALQVIKRQSEALIRFVSEFRSLTHVPTPKLRHVPVADMFEHIRILMNNECEAQGVRLLMHIEPDGLIITADQELLEQVLINLIKNSVQALSELSDEERPEKAIQLRAFQNKHNRPVIHVIDNGHGIDQDALDRIFIPFYTTKRNGSGIGLSLSRQIMRQHKGSITAKSVADEGTQFILKF